MAAQPAVEAHTAGDDADLVELYYERGFSDGLPVVPPTPAKIDAMLAALGGEPQFLECRVPPRWGGR